MNLVMRSGLAACGAAAVCLGCGGANPPAETAQTPAGSTLSVPEASEEPAASSEGGKESLPPEPSAAVVREPLLASSSLPAGLSALSDAERASMEKECKPLMDAIAKIASRDKEHRDRTEAALHALATAPNVAGVDMDKCTAFASNELAVFRAKSIESEAIINIKRIVVGLSDASLSQPPRLCPSAPPVPIDLDAVRSGPHQEPPSGWSAEGWKCARFNLGGAPQRFQYELVTEPAQGTYRIIARGFPVDGHGPEELFLRGKTVDGRVEPSSEVMRK